MLNALEELAAVDILSEATHAALDEDEVDMTLDVWEGKNDIEEDY